MSDIDYLSLFTRLNGFRLIARINRVACDNDLARCAHDRLVAKLGELIELMTRAVGAKRCLQEGADPARVEQASEDLYWIEAEFEHRWISQSQPLLDHLDIDLATQEIFDPRTKRWYALECGPSLREVSDQNLCGLREIIDRIACQTGVSFHAHRIVYGSTELVPSGR
ncbi:hypothetical protein [Ancylobacter polymorphus]|uniref:Uncharacterized protein n=1 Tax=Ancylobacter polymorphus TaxID=223390 RepID=A0A9E7CXM7_9HYPH|nr:hypothetical protein [Ancylobacter polymorphus]UOK73943.1 hypothetical protein K9D25_24465 [Ancylobacter polymorphus]